ncbi:uncharacterized protein E0L32_003903 [Thyridium curvatum]|uniref:EKC/KEOPS complex subunit CGI121 n=1 Tax=Thyridium curvatum TaxID=1093900 RepID=A0A507BC70_9PEZI|nr:uncharacterized protein E0L32_003903 [Thyridium curvatum]TPX16254.1 hypothetical protein E0L32_003903 [Thyridium curvatum]
MALETVCLEHIPSTHSVQVAFFRNVSNPDFLQSQLVARNPDFEYAFIDASSVVSRVQVLAATFKALTLLLSGSLRTPNVHSEIVCSLSPTNNIAEAYRRYGVTPQTKDVIIVKVLFPTEANPQPPSPESIWAHLQEHVKGSPVPLVDENIAAATDLAKVRKYYKLNGAPALNDAKDDLSRKTETEALVLASMALRGV